MLVLVLLHLEKILLPKPIQCIEYKDLGRPSGAFVVSAYQKLPRSLLHSNVSWWANVTRSIPPSGGYLSVFIP